MICPFRVGAKFEYTVVGNDKSNPENYIQIAQTAVFPPCYEDECPYYNAYGGCNRVDDD